MNRANPSNIGYAQENLYIFPNHMFFNVNKANFNQANRHVDYASLRERILNEMTITVADINFGLLFAACLLVNKLINECLGNEDIINNQYLTVTLAALATTLFSFILKINKTKNRTAFYSQSRRKPTDSEVLAALQKIEGMVPDLYVAWKQKLNITTDKECLKYLQNKYNNGMCFGYTIAAIEALADHPVASGKELMRHLRYQTVTEKMALQIMREELTDQQKFGHELGITFISSSNTAMGNKMTQLSYQTPYTDYLNNQCKEIEVKNNTPDMIMNNFYQQATSSAFIDVPHYTPNSSLNCASHYIKKNVLLTAGEKAQLEALKKLRDAETTPINRTFQQFRINEFKNTLNLSTRKNDYIHQHLNSMSQDTILAGEVILNDGEKISHSIMFRHSNGLYYFIDSNFGVDEFQSSNEFFTGLHLHLMNYYYPISNGPLKIYFIMHALNTKNQLYTFDNKPLLQCI